MKRIKIFDRHRIRQEDELELPAADGLDVDPTFGDSPKRKAYKRVKWTEDQLERLRQAHAKGHSLSEIGRELGIGHNAIGRKIDELGLPRIPKPKPAPSIPNLKFA